jgi:hypothetical protein
MPLPVVGSYRRIFSGETTPIPEADFPPSLRRRQSGKIFLTFIGTCGYKGDEFHGMLMEGETRRKRRGVERR